jgi:hypothetical protein
MVLSANMPVGLTTIPISEAYVLDRSPNVSNKQNSWSGLQIHLASFNTVIRPIVFTLTSCEHLVLWHHAILAVTLCIVTDILLDLKMHLALSPLTYTIIT